MASIRFYPWTLIILLALVMVPSATAATYDTASDSPQDRTPTFNPIHQLNLFTLNKFPISVDTVKACGQNADTETRIYCALKESVPGLLDASKGGVNVQVHIGSDMLQTISRVPLPLQPAKGSSTSETYGFDTDGTAYNAIFLDQGTLYVYVGEPSADIAIALIRHLMDESYTVTLNAECRLRTSANAKAIAFKNCQALSAQKTPTGPLQYQKIQCEKPAKTGIIGLTAAINGQCPETVPGPSNLQPAVLPTTSTMNIESTPATTECTAANFVSPIDNAQPRVDSYGDYWWGSTRNTADHHEGLDIKGQDGVTQVKAAGAGTVEAYKTDQCGNGLMVNHGCTIDGKPFRTKYCHLSTKKALPAAGTRVTKGQSIGLMGRTGNIQTGMITHLHVEYMAGGRYEGPVFKGGDFDPVEKGFMPKSFGVPGRSYRQTGVEMSRIEFAEKEELPTVKEYANAFFPANRYQTPAETCTSMNDDENGFFGYRPRGKYSQYGLSKGGCLHFGIDIRGNGQSNGVYTYPVKAMMSGTVVRINADYQDEGKGDYSVVVQSGPWRIAYGHVTFKRGVATSQPTFKIGDAVQKDQIIGYPHPQIQTPNYGGELHINVLYTGTDAKLKALTVGSMRTNAKYKSYFDKYDTRAISQKPDFTFGVNNYDQYFIWQAYTTDLKPLSAVEPSAPASQPQTAAKPNPTTVSDGAPMTDVCVYYYLDAKDGAKDAFFDAGIAAYAGPGGACLVGRAAVSRSDIQYPAGYSGYVNVNELPVAESYEGCYVAKIPLNKHGDQAPTGVNVKLFLSKSPTAFSATEGYLEKGIARTLADEKTIGRLACLPPTPVAVRPADSAEAGNKFLQFAMELQGKPYCLDDGSLPRCGACGTVISYAYAKMLSAGYTLPKEFFTTLNAEKVNLVTSNGKTVTVKNPVAGTLISLRFPDVARPGSTVNIPKTVDVPAPHNSDTWIGLSEIMKWEVPLKDAKPGDLIGYNYPTTQCYGQYTEEQPYGSGGSGCWKNVGHIEMVHSGSGAQLKTFGAIVSGGISIHPPVGTIYKAFRIPWIPPGGATAQSNTASGTKTVVLNMQHDSTSCQGGSGTEYPAGGLVEREEIIKVALKIRQILEPKGYKVLITKEWKWNPSTDSFERFDKSNPTITTVTRAISDRVFTTADCNGPEFEKQAKFVKDNNALGVALHFDSHGGTGATAAYYSKAHPNAGSIALAGKIFAQLGKVNGVSSKKGAVNDAGVGASSGGQGLIFLSELGKIGATGITVEMSAIDNPRLQQETEAFENELAQAISQGIIDYAGTTKATPGAAITKTDFSAITIYETAACVKAAKNACPPKGTARDPNGNVVERADPECVLKVATDLAGISFAVAREVMNKESGGGNYQYQQFAVSESGALGYKQMLAGTARGEGVPDSKFFDAYYNICGGTRYLAKQMKDFGSVTCALAAYNAGPGNVRGKDPATCVPNFAQTKNYVAVITQKAGVA